MARSSPLVTTPYHAASALNAPPEVPLIPSTRADREGTARRRVTGDLREWRRVYPPSSPTGSPSRTPIGAGSAISRPSANPTYSALFISPMWLNACG